MLRERGTTINFFQFCLNKIRYVHWIFLTKDIKLICTQLHSKWTLFMFFCNRRRADVRSKKSKPRATFIIIKPLLPPSNIYVCKKNRFEVLLNLFVFNVNFNFTKLKLYRNRVTDHKRE